MRRAEPSGRAGRLVLTGEGLAWLGAALVLGMVGWLKSINLVLILAYMMAVLIVLNGWLARRHAARVAASRTGQPPVFAGETVASRVTVANTSRRPATVRVEDLAPDEPVAWFFHRLPGRTTTPCAASRVYRQRGRVASTLAVSSGFPLALVRYDRPAAESPELVVLPAIGQVDALALRHWLLHQSGGDGRARKVLRRVTSDQADVRGVRPYRPGDPIREIHWRSSARRGELMVREYDAAPSPELVLVVEPWLPEEPTVSDAVNLETALSLAATIAWAWGRQFDARVTIAVAGQPDSVRSAGPTDDALREALTPLADVRGATSFEALGPRSFDRSLQRAARLVVSSRRSSPYAAALGRSTGRTFLGVSPADWTAWYQPPSANPQGGD